MIARQHKCSRKGFVWLSFFTKKILVLFLSKSKMYSKVGHYHTKVWLPPGLLFSFEWSCTTIDESDLPCTLRIVSTDAAYLYGILLWDLSLRTQQLQLPWRYKSPTDPASQNPTFHPKRGVSVDQHWIRGGVGGQLTLALESYTNRKAL